MLIKQIYITCASSNVNSEGNPIHQTKEGIINFWKWFGNSKVVDQQGRPLVVYHGTRDAFDVFDAKKIGRIDAGYYGWGFYFTQDLKLASVYGIHKLPVYIKIEKPLILHTDSSGSATHLLKDLGYESQYPKAVTRKLLSHGYDGVIVKRGVSNIFGNKGDLLEIVVLEDSWDTDRYDFELKKGVPNIPIQANAEVRIKAVDNNGSFDPNNGNIRG